MKAVLELQEVESIPKRKGGGNRKGLVELLDGSITVVRANPGKAYRLAVYENPSSASRTVSRLRSAVSDINFVSRQTDPAEDGTTRYGVFAQAASKTADKPAAPAKKAAK